jgi:hypothetical protein
LSILAEQQESAGGEHVNNPASDKFILSRKNTSLDQYVSTGKSSASFALQRRNQSIVEEEDGDEGVGEGGGGGDEGDAKPGKNFNKINSLSSVSASERNKILRELFSDFDILLAQRDFEKAVEMLLKIRQSSSIAKAAITTATSNNSDVVQQLIYKQKETELINILRKDLTGSKERGNSKGVLKTGKRVVNSLIKLKIYDEVKKIRKLQRITTFLPKK